MEFLSPSKRETALAILRQIEDAIVRLQERTAHIHAADDFLASAGGMEKLDAACMLLIAIGESLKGFDKVTEKRVLPTCPQIPWRDIMGVRDIIAHHYFDVDVEEIFEIIHSELTPLLEAIRLFEREMLEGVLKFSPELREHINNALEDMEKGRVYTTKEVEKRMKERFK